MTSRVDYPTLVLIVSLSARLLLAAVFAIAGIAKFRQRAVFQQTLIAFAAPAALTPALAIALPSLELILAAALLPTRTAPFAALGALLLLVLFTLVIARTLLRGAKPACQCFGALSAEPIGVSTLVRNGVLFGLSYLALSPGAEALGLSELLNGPAVPLSRAALGVVLAVGVAQTYLIGQLLLGQQRLLQRVGVLEARPTSAQRGLPVGSLAPSFSAPALRGEPQTLEGLLAAGRPLLLFFFDPECGPCHAYLPHLARWQAGSRGRIRFVLLGRRMEGKAEDPAYAPFSVLGQEDREIGKRYLVSSIPSALIIGAEGRIQSPLAIGHEAIEQLLTSALGEKKESSP